MTASGESSGTAGAITIDNGLTESSMAAARRGSTKAFRRLIWFLILCYVASYLDRINIGYANLTMADDLGLTATMFGFASSVFFIAYVIFEIPSNLALAKFGARLWIPRIMISWGIASCLTMFAWDHYSLYVLRFLVGAAEAGLVPGVILYLSYWFVARDRARANALFITGSPVAMMIGAPISGLILGLDGLGGLHGWQWLFLLEGIPSIALGIVAYFYLVDGPAKASWLTDEEKQGMQAAIAAEQAAHPAPHKAFRWRDLSNPTLALLAITFFCSVANNNTLGTWTPLVVKEILGNTDRVVLIGLVSAIPPLVALPMIPLWSWSSDRRNERKLHLAFALGLSAAGWIMMAVFSAPVVKLAGLTLTAVGGLSFIGVFWALAIPLLSPASRPAAIGVISTTGLLASILSPSVVGVLRDLTHSFNAGFWYVATLQLFGIVALLLASRHQRRVDRGLVAAS